MEGGLINLLVFFSAFAGCRSFHARINVGYVPCNLVAHSRCCPLQKHFYNQFVLFKVVRKLVGETSDEFFGHTFNVFRANLSQASLPPKQPSSMPFQSHLFKVNIHNKKSKFKFTRYLPSNLSSLRKNLQNSLLFGLRLP